MNNYIINKGFHNTTTKKAVPCDLIKALVDAKNEILKITSTRDYRYYKNNYVENFEKLENGDYDKDYGIGSCVLCLLNMEGHEKYIDSDVIVYTDEMYTNNRCPSKYNGVTKLTNGADVIGFHVYCEEAESTLFQFLYYDGEKLRIFTPYEGNAVNIITRTALGDETCRDADDYDDTCTLCSVIFPNGTDVDLYEDITLTDANGEEYELEQRDCIVYNYLNYFGADVKPNESYKADLNTDCIDAEVESVLC